MDERKLSSREIARRAVQNRIQEVAEALFAEHGFPDTTVSAIAAGVGISERTFFRYFATKDDLLFASFAADTQWAIDSVKDEPVGADPWDSLQIVVESALDRLDSEAQRRSALFQRIAAESPQVYASYLAHQRAFQRSLADTLWVRWQSTHPSRDDRRVTEGQQAWPEERIVLNAIVSSVFSALNEVIALSSECTPEEQRRFIRGTMSAMRPSQTELSRPSGDWAGA